LKYQLVEVTWDDATELAGWEDGPEAPKPCLVKSVGYLVHKCRNYVIIAQDLSHDGMKHGRGQIPRGCVKRIQILKKKG
jgi:hypothetical protein